MGITAGSRVQEADGQAAPPSTVHRGRGEPGEGAVQMAEHLSEGTGHMGVVTAVAKGGPGAGRSEPGRRGVCSV